MWLTTAAATSTALSAPLAGQLIDTAGPPAGYLFALALGLAAPTFAFPAPALPGSLNRLSPA